MLQDPEHVHAHVDDYLHELLSPVEVAYVERHCEGCGVCRAALEEAQRRLHLIQIVPAYEASDELVKRTSKHIDDTDAARRRFRRRFAGGFALATAASVALLIGANAYFSNLRASSMDLRVLGQSSFFAGTKGGLRVQLADRGDGAPRANVPVEVALVRQDRKHTLASFTTNADGTYPVGFDIPDELEGDWQLQVVAHTPLGDEVLERPIKLVRAWKLMLSSDKPVYQPGQEIKLRALALRRPDLRPRADETVVFTITDPKGNLIFKQEKKTSAYGIAASECPLATELIEGGYTLACRLGDVVSNQRVEISKYVLPRFKVEVTLDQPYYQPGQPVLGTVQADYFFGKPLANAEVQIGLTQEQQPMVAMPDDDVPERARIRQPQRGDELEKKITVRTDARGKAAFRLELPAAHFGREMHGGDARVFVEATVIDSGKHQQSRRVGRIVTNRLIRVQAVPEGGTLVKDLANRVYLFATYPDGKPVADARLSVREAHHGDRVEPGEVRTDKLGMAVCELTPRTNQVVVQVEARDAEGRTGSQGTGLGCGRFAHDFLVRPDQAVYTAGDTMHLSALGGGASVIYLDILRDGHTIVTDTIEMKDGKGEYHFDIPAELSGTLELCAYRFGADGLPIRRSRAVYVKQANQLAIKTTPDRNEYRPGDPAKLRFTLTDASGKPAPGAISLAAVDEAVFSVLKQAPGMERTFFTLEAELLQPIYTIYPWDPAQRPDLPMEERKRFEQGLFARTAQTSVEQSFRAPEQAGRGRRDGVEPDVGVAMMEVERGVPSPGEGLARQQHSLTASSYLVKLQDAEHTRDLAFKWIVGGWAALIVSCLLTGYVWLWVLVRPLWMIVGHVFVGLPLVAISLIGTTASQRFAAVGDAMREDAAMMERGAPQREAEGRDGGSSVRVRREFPETLLWVPQLITDDQGNASLDLTLADSITTWRLTASAVDGSGRLGSDRADIKVFQPFFVELDLPVSLTRHDEVAVPVTVYNYLKEPQTVVVSLEEATWFSLAGNPIQKLEMAPNEVRSIHYRVRALKVGSLPMQVSARAGDVADAVKRQVEVVPDGKMIEQVINDRFSACTKHTIGIPETAVPDSYKIVVKIYPGVFSQIVEGLDGMLRMPNGCFEQTSSSAYPNLLIMDYLRKTRTASPELQAKAEQYLQVGYQRLLTFERPGGGFDWWGRDPAVVWLSAYGLQEFNDMSKVMTIDTGILQRTQNYLLGQQNSDGSWDKIGATHGETIEQMGNAKLLLTSYIVWSLLDSGMSAENNPKLQKAVTYILDHLDDAGRNPYVLALVGNALASWNSKDARTLAVLNTLNNLARAAPDGNVVSFPSEGTTLTYARSDGAVVETTALAALAFLKADAHPATANRAVGFIIKAKQAGGTWGSTQATILSLKVLIASMGVARQEGDVAFSVGLNGAKGTRKVITPQNADVMQIIDLQSATRTGDNELTLDVEGKSNLMYQVIARHYQPWPKGPKPGKALDLTVDYERRELTTSDVLKARATLRYQGRQPTYMVMVDLGIPPGFQPDASEFEAMVQARKVAKYSITSRQIILYLGDVRPGDVLTFDYTLKPRFPVKVQTPASTAYEYNTPADRVQAAPVELIVK